MLRVLVVDDARLLADLTGTALGRESVELRRVGPREDIVETAAAERPHVVIVSDGDSCFEPLGACRRLRSHPKTRETRIVYVGSFLSRPSTRRAGIDLFLPRFVEPHELREALARVLGIQGRTARRWRVDLPCTFISDGARRGGSCVDLSLSGCFVALDLPVAAGAEGRLRLEGAAETAELDARAVRSVDGPDGRRGTAFAFRTEGVAMSVSLSRFIRQAADRRTAAQGYAAEIEQR